MLGELEELWGVGRGDEPAAKALVPKQRKGPAKGRGSLGPQGSLCLIWDGRELSSRSL